MVSFLNFLERLDNVQLQGSTKKNLNLNLDSLSVATQSLAMPATNSVTVNMNLGSMDLNAATGIGAQNAFMKVNAQQIVAQTTSGDIFMQITGSQAVAARSQPDWPLASVTCCSGGGDAPNNEARKTLNTYDGTREHLRKIIEVMFVDQSWAKNEAYLDRRLELANLPGAWEATAAARFKAPFRDGSGDRRERDSIDYAQIKVPTLVFAGRHDTLREPGYTDGFVPNIPDCELHVFEKAGHMGNIECADEFNTRVLKFLKRVDG